MKVFKTDSEVFDILHKEFSDFVLGTETVPLYEASDRICARDIEANIDVPHFDKSTVDGYAVRCQKTFSANDENPAVFDLIGEVKTGEIPDFKIQEGQAAKIFTGGAVPEGADAVVMLENTVEQEGRVFVFKPARPNENILKKGEDVGKGCTVVKKYQRLRAPQIGVLAAVGQKEVEVFSRLKVGIISTGDEIIMQDQPLEGAKIYDVNSYTLYSALKQEYAVPKLYGIVKDDYEALVGILSRAVSENDVVLISGGSSVGTYDNTLKAIQSLDEAIILVDGISIKPGKPTIIAKAGNKAVFGLPGHPVSCLFIFKFFVKKLFDILLHQQDTAGGKVLARLKSGFAASSGRTEFVFVKLIYSDEILAEPLYGKSGSINLLNNASGYVKIEATRTGLKPGDLVEVVLL
ncbi:MAG: molybdopterin molybdotransferase MoeA [Caldicoprobacter oshimai]|uniref:Molybdopterin molybdenumtransferase n=1 Tax=Caldicoprobacter faecalis TaxID=937334 RepID=A0A1I5ST19_9FIRM|nr:gephyrin-like molybdotransferase Glp [Caldicoprobacter faecalis]PZN10129.1 MAG: molybdopterin molybdenumtransferase MoeA [Caldicoprobacter oshimai]SFP73838.1 molybdopterin molybdochelatase [Caldicoprobacter faecalis]